MANLRVADWAFFAYFALQIPTTLLFDTQGVFPEWLYPGFLKSIRSMYLTTYRDPFLADAWKHPWYLSICLVEHFIEVPFFFWAAYVYFHYGAKNYSRIVGPSMMYGVHTATAIIGVWAMAMGSEFNQSATTATGSEFNQSATALAPRNFGERIHLCSAYAIFFFMSVWMIIDNLFLIAKLKTKSD